MTPVVCSVNCAPKAPCFSTWGKAGAFRSWWMLVFGMAGILVQAEAASAESYRAAVLEHVRFGELDSPPNEVVRANMRGYSIAAAKASENRVDIIVFPEFGLFPHTKHNRSVARSYGEDIPDPSRLSAPVNPCDQMELFEDRFVLNRLSCLAKENRLFVVANMVDAKKCTSEICEADAISECSDACPEDGLLLHNTNVVFDRTGNLIARYYKRHPYFEFDLNLPRDLQHTYFQTEFGTFTTFICFDMSFRDSAESVSKPGVVNVAYPTYWYDHHPFAVGPQIQQAWAMTHGVNLLAANVHLPGTGTMGSGIYSGSRGALIYTHNPDGRSKLLISDVPILPGNSDVQSNARQYSIDGDKATEIDQEIPSFNEDCAYQVLGIPTNPATEYRCALNNVTGYKFSKLHDASGSLEVCDNELCCLLEYESDSMSEDYVFASFSGMYNLYGAFEFGNQVCLLSRCSGSPCSTFPVISNTVFRRVKISAKFLTPDVYPSVLHSGLRLASKDMWSYDADHGLEYVNPAEGDHASAPLLLMGLYARRYDLDKIV